MSLRSFFSGKLVSNNYLFVIYKKEYTREGGEIP